mgnify:CR=1 FL=1
MSSTSVYEAVADGAVLLTVTRRLARHHVHRYGLWQCARGVLWWEAPRILPLRAWLAEVHDAALAADLSTRVRVPDIVQQRLWRRALGREAVDALLDPDAAARQAAQARRLGHAWRCLDGPGDYLSHDQLAWRRWAGRYVARCEREGLVDDAVLADHVAELVAPRDPAVEGADVEGADVGGTTDRAASRRPSESPAEADAADGESAPGVSRVTLAGGERRVQDGPFAETKETLGGYFAIDVPNLDEAMKWAEKCPHVHYGKLEIRASAMDSV